MASATILDAMTDPQLFGNEFGGPSYEAWRALLGGFYGLPLTQEQADIFGGITGGRSAPAEACAELWLAIGRRGGKSRGAAFVATCEATFNDHRAKLAPGEVATVLVIAADRQQARTVMRYIRGFFDHPMLRPLVARETETVFELSNRCAIEIATASHRAVRGYTLAAVIADEVAFWMADGASPDEEILAALRPALATLGGKLVALSSPYARRGALWNVYRKHFGQDGRILVAQAPSRTMNPTLPQVVIDDAMKNDPARASAEYLAVFRSDISSLIDEDLVRDCTRPKPRELPRASGITYRAFTDPSGGGADGFSLAIGHRQGDHAVIDLVRELHGSPAQIAAEHAATMKAYGIRTVVGDRYAGKWPADEFLKQGITYQTSELDRSALYLEFLARLNSGQVELPPIDKLARQLCALERRTGRGGRDSVDHPPGGHDDLANVVAGAVTLLSSKSRGSGTRRELLI